MWSVPCVPIVSTAPPISPAQNVYGCDSENRKSNICKLVLLGRKLPRSVPAAVDMCGNHKHGGDRADHINHELNAIVPHDRPHAAKERIDDRDHSHHKHARASKSQPASFCSTIAARNSRRPSPKLRVTRNEQRCRPPHQPAEPLVEHLIGRK